MSTTETIIIVEHRSEWCEEFQAIARPLLESLGKVALRIDHIGSTSVPGLAAKDVIDIQVTVQDFTSELEAACDHAGYSRLEINCDHRPPATTEPDRHWEKQMYRPSSKETGSPETSTRAVNLHVRRAGSANGRYALLFRDYLRLHPLAAQAYGQAKAALAKHNSYDWDFYYDVKDPICDIIMAGAEDWAVSSCWNLEHYASST